MLCRVASTEHTRYFLELACPQALRPRAWPAGEWEVRELEADELELARWLHRAVGDAYWGDRRDWDEARWRAWIERPTPRTWVASGAQGMVGYWEHELTAARVVTMHCFGLLPAFIGRGLGGALLTEASRRAFEMGAQRIELDTATDDHPAALPNYLARGYRLLRQEPLADPMPARG